jgi:uncharacterized protein (DUF849 family)
MTLIQACLNGRRQRGEHPALPLTADALARDARAAVAAGARSLHVHARDLAGAESVARDDVARTVATMRAACPSVELSVSTGLWMTGRDEAARHAAIATWTVLPDLVSLNLSEPAWEALGALVHSRGVSIEAGLVSVSDAEALVAADLPVHRVLVEAELAAPEAAVALGSDIDAVLDASGHTAPRLHHGSGPATWAVLDAAVARGHDIRVGLEDVFELPDGTPAPDNAGLLMAATARYL